MISNTNFKNNEKDQSKMPQPMVNSSQHLNYHKQKENNITCNNNNIAKNK